MLKLTKKLLNEHKVYNPYEISKLTGKLPYISYTPSTTGVFAQYAYWSVTRIGYITTPQGNKSFTVYNRQDKEPKLTDAKAWVKERYNLDITERDVWGNWHVTGTMDKLREIISK